MGKWKGVMVVGFLEMPVTVNFGSPTLHAREWSGSGATDKYWPMTPLAFETNIGDVVILSQAFRKDGKHHIEFRGSGDPRGPLADIMLG